MLEKLTEKQVARLNQIRDEWIKIGLCTDPANREATISGAKQAYQIVNLPFPTHIEWVLNPLEGISRAAELLKIKKNSVIFCYGQHEAGYLSFYAAIHEFGVDCSKLNGLWTIAKNCHWWWSLTNVVIFCDRPKTLLRDEQNRLHSSVGPAMQYRDNYSLYAWHGVRLTNGNWIEHPETIDIQKDIFRNNNQELKRIACEILGWEKVLSQMQAREIQRDDFGVLIETPSIGDGDLVARFVKVKCPSTNRSYILRVPPDTRSAHEGCGFTFNMQQYNPQSQT